MIELSKKEARKLILLSQKVLSTSREGRSIDVTLNMIEHLGYIQIDTLSVIQRAHHHTIWNRNHRYTSAHLDELLARKQVFEYWSHAAAYLPMCNYRYSLIRKRAISEGSQKHWNRPDHPLMNEIKKRIADEGPLMARDFEGKGSRKGAWTSKPAKQALEYLFIQGDLMIPYRINFQKVYDLTDRTLPADVDVTMPTKQEYARYLVTSFLTANGLAAIHEMVYLLKNIKRVVATVVEDMHSSGELIQVRASNNLYYALPDSFDLLQKKLARSQVRILSPFDNLLIQRKRMKAFFDYDYLLECYLPQNKRTYGYFSLPLLWDGRLIGRMDCKHERAISTLHIWHLSLALNNREVELFAIAFSKELVHFMAFNGSQNCRLHRVTPPQFKSVIETSLSL